MDVIPKVSVVIKSYNHAAYVRQCISSVLEQSFQDFEIVVTDDASTDGTAEIIREFKDPRIHLQVLPRNHGISIAMNMTIARTRGEYLAILNSDDFALPGRLEKQVAFLDQNPEVSVLFGFPLTVDDHGTPTAGLNTFIAPKPPARFTRAVWLRHLFFPGNCFCAPTAMIRRQAYAGVGQYDPRLTNLQDYDMWIRMLMTGREFHVLPEQVTAFRIRTGGANMSAPRLDTILRTQFEQLQILKHFANMTPQLLSEVFAEDLKQKGIAPEMPPETWLVDLALGKYSLFALQILFDTAKDLESYDRLRDLAGRVDIFNWHSLYMRDKEIVGLKQELARLKSPDSPH